MTNKWLNYLAAFLVLVFYLLATVGGNRSDRSSAAAARNPEAGCWPQDVFLPLALSDYINYFPGTQEIEPNNSYQEANGPLVSGLFYSGHFNDERDFFSIYVQTAGPITIDLTTNVTADLQLQLFFQSTNNRVGFDPTAPYQIIYNGQPGWYYIFIYSSASYPTPPTYLLTATYPLIPTPQPHTPIPTPTCPPTRTPTPTATLPPDWYEIGSGSASNGGISNNSGSSTGPSIAIASDNRPYVAWSDGTNVIHQVYVRRWNGNSWVEVGAGSASGGGISNSWTSTSVPTIAIAPDNTPYVAWWIYDGLGGTSEIYVRRWNGSNWIDIGSIGNGSSRYPSLAVAPDNTPYITWKEGSEIYVGRWNGSNWEYVGTGSVSNNSGLSNYPAVAIAPDNTPYIAWEDDSSGDFEIYVRRWNGSSWAEVSVGSASGGGISDNSGRSERVSLAVAPNGTPYVSWQDDSSGNNEIYVRRWNGSVWADVGSGSASGGGISNTSGSSQHPTIAVAPDYTPYLVWSENDGTNSDIYVRRWNGTNWAEVGSGSASGSGISNTGYAYEPVIAIAPNNVPYVAWYDNTLGNAEIYIRRWLE